LLAVRPLEGHAFRGKPVEMRRDYIGAAETSQFVAKVIYGNEKNVHEAAL
jgi:hypothetical protein